jgi:hypothetical protein
MTSSNRLLNRILLLIVGLGMLAAAAWLGVPLVTGRAWGITLPPLTGTPALAIIAGASVVAILLALVWIFTRGRGRRRAAVQTPLLQLDASALTSLVSARLSESPDVVAADASAFRLRGQHVVRLRVQARKGADVEALTGQVRRVIADVDAVLGTELPVVAHLTSGWRTALSGARATH